MKKRNEYPECPFMVDHSDCFSLTYGHLCFCLQDTNFKNGRDCPFYKPESEVDHEIVMKKYLEE